MRTEIDLVFIDPEEEQAPQVASAEIITIPNRLKYRVGQGGFDMVKIQNAHFAFEKEKSRLKKEGQTKVSNLSSLIKRAERTSDMNEKEVILHEMKSLTLIFQSCSGFNGQQDIYKTTLAFLPFIVSLNELNSLTLAICKIYNMTIMSSIKHQSVKGMSFNNLSKLLSQACNCYQQSQEYGTYKILEENFGFLKELAPGAVQRGSGKSFA